jgi:hypothetical protein
MACQAAPGPRVAATGTGSNHRISVAAPNSSKLGLSPGLPITDVSHSRLGMHSSPQCIGAAAAAVDASQQQMPPDVLLPAVQLESFYSKPMSPAEAAAEAAAMAGAIVAAARAAAAERVNSSRSCSPYSQSPSLGIPLSDPQSGSGDVTQSAPRVTLIIGDDGDELMEPQHPPSLSSQLMEPTGQQVSVTGSDSVSGALTATTSGIDAAIDSQPGGFQGPTAQQPAMHTGLAGAAGAGAGAAGAGASSRAGVVQEQLCADDPNQALFTASSLGPENWLLPAGCQPEFELECTPDSSVSDAGRGFDPCFGLGLPQDEDLAWLEGCAGLEGGPADWDLSDIGCSNRII